MTWIRLGKNDNIMNKSAIIKPQSVKLAGTGKIIYGKRMQMYSSWKKIQTIIEDTNVFKEFRKKVFGSNYTVFVSCFAQSTRDDTYSQNGYTTQGEGGHTANEVYNSKNLMDRYQGNRLEYDNKHDSYYKDWIDVKELVEDINKGNNVILVFLRYHRFLPLERYLNSSQSTSCQYNGICWDGTNINFTTLDTCHTIIHEFKAHVENKILGKSKSISDEHFLYNNLSGRSSPNIWQLANQPKYSNTSARNHLMELQDSITRHPFSNSAMTIKLTDISNE